MASPNNQLQQVISTELLKSPMVVNLISIILVKPLTVIFKKAVNVFFYLILISISIDYLFSSLTIDNFDGKSFNLFNYSYLYSFSKYLGNLIQIDSSCNMLFYCKLREVLQVHPVIDSIFITNSSQLFEENCKSVFRSCNFEHLYSNVLESLLLIK